MKLIPQQFLYDTFSAWNKADLSYLLLRGYRQLPYCENDVDILVHETDVEIAIGIMSDALRVHEIEVVRKVKRFGLTSFYLHSIHGEYQLDFFTKLVKRWTPYVNANLVLKQRIAFREFFVPQPQHECLIILLKEYLTYGRPREKYRTLKNCVLDEKSIYEASGQFFSTSIIRKVLVSHNRSGDGWDYILVRRKWLQIMEIRAFVIWLSLRFNA